MHVTVLCARQQRDGSSSRPSYRCRPLFLFLRGLLQLPRGSITGPELPAEPPDRIHILPKTLPVQYVHMTPAGLPSAPMHRERVIFGP